MAISSQDLLDALKKFELLHDGEIERLAAQLRDRPDAKADDIAADLLQRGLLTPYQIQVLVHGRSDPLLLGNYAIHDEVGAGGMGRVYKAYHRRMDRLVALKVIKSEALGSSVAVQRFQQEVRTAARLHHPNIVTAYDADEAHGVQYLVMEFVEGQDLGSIVRKNGALPVSLAVDYVLQAATGLHYAHQQGVIHRDIKPSNLLLDRHGVVKILDMGLARTMTDVNRDGETNGRAELTVTGMVFGTIDYISPEQALSARKADARSDMYSLGCCLFYLLTATPIFRGESLVQVLMAHREATAPSLESMREDIPPKLEEIYQRMVAKSPDDRYATMGDVVRELRELSQNNLPSESPTVLLPADLTSPKRTKSKGLWSAIASGNRRWVIIPLSIAVVALVAILVALNGFRPEKESGNSTTAGGNSSNSNSGAAQRSLADLIEQVEPAIVRIEANTDTGTIRGSGFVLSDDGTVATNFHVMRGAKKATARFANGTIASVVGFRAVDSKNDVALIKIETLKEHKLVALELVQQLPRKGEPVFAFGAPLDFQFTPTEGIVSSVRTGSELLNIAHQGGNLSAWEFTPDSSWIQTTAAISPGNSGGPLIDMNGRVVGLNTWSMERGQSLNFAVSAKVVEALLHQSTGEIEKLADVAEPTTASALAPVPRQLSGERAAGEAHRFTTHKDEVLDIAISKTGRFLASASKDKTVHLHDLQKLSFMYELKSDVAEAWCVAFSHDERLMFTGWDPKQMNLKVYDRRTGTVDKTGTGNDAGEMLGRETGTLRIETSRDGRSMVSAHDGGIIDLRFLNNVKQVYPLLAHDRAEPCYDATFSNDGRLLASAGGDGMIFIYDIENFPPPLGFSKMQVHDKPVRAIAFSSDATYIASASDDHTVKVWSPYNMQDQWQVFKQFEHEGPVTCVAFSNDGKWIASGGDDQVVRLWSVQADEKHAFTGHEGAITQVAFLPQGEFLASSSRDGSVRLWKMPQ